MSARDRQRCRLERAGWKRGWVGGARKETYAIQMRRDATVGINSGLFTAKLGDLADDYDILADVRVEIGAGNAGGR